MCQKTRGRRWRIKLCYSLFSGKESLLTIDTTRCPPSSRATIWRLGQGTISDLDSQEVDGQYGTHTVKVVREDQTDLLGATVSVNMVGSIDGTFLYSALPAMVILEATKRTI
jgi:hypothetical protein